MSLNNLSNQLSDVGDTAGALDAIKEAVEIRRKLSEASPKRYLPDLAMGTYGTTLLKLKDYSKAEEIFAEGVNLIQPFAEKFPNSPYEKLYNALKSDLERARDEGH
jgi:tetratricopeptide (TPR) repeat protein